MKKIFMICFIGLLVLTGCTSLESKAVGVASNINGFKLESAGSISTGTIMPNIVLGSIQSSVATAPALNDGERTQVVISYTESNSFFGDLFGVDATTRTFSYIGLPSEKSEDTEKRIKAVTDLLKK